MPGYYITTPRLHADSVAACKSCATEYLSKIPGASAHPAVGRITSCDLHYEHCDEAYARRYALLS